MRLLVGQVGMKRLGEPPQIGMQHARFNGSEVANRHTEPVDQHGKLIVFGVKTVNDRRDTGFLLLQSGKEHGGLQVMMTMQHLGISNARLYQGTDASGSVWPGERLLARDQFTDELQHPRQFIAKHVVNGEKLMDKRVAKLLRCRAVIRAVGHF